MHRWSGFHQCTTCRYESKCRDWCGSPDRWLPAAESILRAVFPIAIKQANNLIVHGIGITRLQCVAVDIDIGGHGDEVTCVGVQGGMIPPNVPAASVHAFLLQRLNLHAVMPQGIVPVVHRPEWTILPWVDINAMELQCIEQASVMVLCTVVGGSGSILDCDGVGLTRITPVPVSYTHLTLPTILLV